MVKLPAEVVQINSYEKLCLDYSGRAWTYNYEGEYNKLIHSDVYSLGLYRSNRYVSEDRTVPSTNICNAKTVCMDTLVLDNDGNVFSIQQNGTTIKNNNIPGIKKLCGSTLNCDSFWGITQDEQAFIYDMGNIIYANISEPKYIAKAVFSDTYILSKNGELFSRKTTKTEFKQVCECKGVQFAQIEGELSFHIHALTEEGKRWSCGPTIIKPCSFWTGTYELLPNNLPVWPKANYAKSARY
jgi:hypothetical protein